MGYFTSTLTGELDTVLIKNSRMIGMEIPDCVIEEVAVDRLEITRHPVEADPATITDHSFPLPAQLVMRVLWSDSANSDSTANIVNTLEDDADQATIVDTYQRLLDLQTSRQPFTVITGKRTYDNMLMTLIQNNTDKDREYILDIECHFEEIRIVTTQSAALAPLVEQVNQAEPENTSPTVDTGTKQPVAVNNSLLVQASSLFKNILR